MKIREITVEVKKSRNYQTYTSGEIITIQEGDDVEAVRREGMARCRKAVQEQIAIDMPK